MSKKFTTESFILKAQSVHGDRYDYSLSEYTKAKVKLIVICKKHGNFMVNPNNHISCKSGCPQCAGNLRLTQEEWINRANKVHNFKFDYSEVIYNSNSQKVKIICPVHGLYSQNAYDHAIGHGCQKCYLENLEEEKNPNWRNGSKGHYTKLRNSKENCRWIRKIKKNKDNCECCEKQFTGNFREKQAHHLNSWKDFPEQRLDESNGVVLCVSCHMEFHSIYGFGGNTSEQYYEFKALVN